MHDNTVERSFKSPILLRNASRFSASEKGEKACANFSRYLKRATLTV
jgi:hypothetical protein